MTRRKTKVNPAAGHLPLDRVYVATIRTIADRWAGAECTLNGKPAKVTGRLNAFATVGYMDGTGSVEFHWQLVNRIMQGDKAFIAENF